MVAGTGTHEVADSGYAGIAGFGVLAPEVLTKYAAGGSERGFGCPDRAVVVGYSPSLSESRSAPPTSGITYQRAPLASLWSPSCPLERMHAPLSLKIGAP